MEIILDRFFLFFSNANVPSAKQNLTKKFYTLAKTLLIIKKMKMICQKKILTIILDLNKKAFTVHIAFLDLSLKISIYPAKRQQILLLLSEKVIILIKYTDFVNIFSKIFIIQFFKCFAINKYQIDLELGKPLYYGLIYSLGTIELKIFKTYIKINLINYFIWPLKSLERRFILFIQKPNHNIRLFIYYQQLNSLIIKN